MKQNRTKLSTRGFSLIEVTMTIGVVTFALVGLMGILPVALDHTRTCINETRAAHLARMVFSTLQSEPYTAVKCFSPSDSTTAVIDLTKLEKKSPAIVLYATYKVRTGASSEQPQSGETGSTSTEEVRIVRAVNAPTDTEYKLELKVDPVAVPTDGDTGTQEEVTAASARGQNLRLTITQTGNNKVVFEGVQFVARLLRGVQPQ